MCLTQDTYACIVRSPSSSCPRTFSFWLFACAGLTLATFGAVLAGFGAIRASTLDTQTLFALRRRALLYGAGAATERYDRAHWPELHAGLALPGSSTGLLSSGASSLWERVLVLALATLHVLLAAALVLCAQLLDFDGQAVTGEGGDKGRGAGEQEDAGGFGGLALGPCWRTCGR